MCLAAVFPADTGFCDFAFLSDSTKGMSKLWCGRSRLVVIVEKSYDMFWNPIGLLYNSSFVDNLLRWLQMGLAAVFLSDNSHHCSALWVSLLQSV